MKKYYLTALGGFLLWLSISASWAQIVVDDSQSVPDVRVLIDISGSMKQNDPQNLRKPALELLVQLFPAGTKAGVWSFGQWVNMLVNHQVVDESWRQAAMPQAAKINSVALHTNIPAALEKATDDLAQLDPAYKTSLILLTDGMVDVSRDSAENQRARQKIIDEILPRLRAAGVTVHTVALSQNADRDLMEKLAIQTGGLAAVAETAEDLTEIFLQAFDAAAPAEELPIEGNQFLVDSSVEEFTALIFRREGTAAAVLTAPDKKRYSAAQHGPDVNWYSQGNYELVTVKRPYEGQWLIEAELEPNSRVTVVSNLSLVVSRLSKSLFLGDAHQLKAQLQEQQKPVVDENFLKLLDVDLLVSRREDGKGWQRSLSLAEDSSAGYISSLDMLDRPGVYDVSVKVDGKTFQREQRQTIQLRQSFAITELSSDNEPPSHSLIITKINPELDSSSLKWVALIRKPDGSTFTAPVVENGADRWQLDLQTESPGVYEVRLDASGNTVNGAPFSYQSEMIRIEHVIAGAPAVVETPAVESGSQPLEEQAQEAAPPPAAEPEESWSWKQLAMYAGIGLGNLLILALGFVAYKMVMGTGKSAVLEESDDIEAPSSKETVAVVEPVKTQAPVSADIAEADQAATNTEAPEDGIADIDDFDEDVAIQAQQEQEDTKKKNLTDEDMDSILDLPDDAIDIDPAADDED